MRRMLQVRSIEAIVGVLIGLLLYGVFSGTQLALNLLLFLAARWTALAVELNRKPVTPQQWEEVRHRLLAECESECRAGVDPNPGGADVVEPPSALERAEVRYQRLVRSYSPPRSQVELVAEAIGVTAYALLIPACVALHTRDFFSLRAPQGWKGIGVVAFCLGLYAWPLLWRTFPYRPGVRVIWWVVPFVLGLPFLGDLLKTRHPYLDPRNPDHTRLAAERVLALKNPIVAGRHADWVIAYGRRLEEEGRMDEAKQFFREGLRLDASNVEALSHLARLEHRSMPTRGETEALHSVIRPLVLPGEPPLPRRLIDAELLKVDRCQVVIVAVGEVSDALLDAVGHSIQRELDLPVSVSIRAVPLPPSTRTRGLIIGKQWSESSLVQSFITSTKQFPDAPIRYLLITPVDIFMEEANFVFSATYAWGALVSSARFENGPSHDSVTQERCAKQSLCALIKSFKVPVSTDRNCVTSYTRTLSEFDEKGNRPNAETLVLFRRAVDLVNEGWRTHQALRFSESPF